MAVGVPVEDHGNSDSRRRADFPVSPAGRGGILEALRRSLLVGADAIAKRPFEPGRATPVNDEPSATPSGLLTL